MHAPRPCHDSSTTPLPRRTRHAPTLAAEVRLIDPRHPAAPPRLVAPRAEGVTYLVEQLDADWLLLIASTARGAPLCLATAPLASLPTPHAQWRPFWHGGGEGEGGGEGGGQN